MRPRSEEGRARIAALKIKGDFKKRIVGKRLTKDTLCVPYKAKLAVDPRGRWFGARRRRIAFGERERDELFELDRLTEREEPAPREEAIIIERIGIEELAVDRLRLVEPLRALHELEAPSLPIHAGEAILSVRGVLPKLRKIFMSERRLPALKRVDAEDEPRALCLTDKPRGRRALQKASYDISSRGPGVKGELGHKPRGEIALGCISRGAGDLLKRSRPRPVLARAIERARGEEAIFPRLAPLPSPRLPEPRGGLFIFFLLKEEPTFEAPPIKRASIG